MKHATSSQGTSLLPHLSVLALRLLFTIPISVGLSVATAAQTTYPKVIYLSPATSTKPMTVNDVIKLSKAGLSDDLIIEQLRKQGQTFDLSTDQLIQLKTAHVSERVIEVMINPSGGPPSTVEKKPALVAPAASSATPAQPAPQANRQADPPSPAMPTEIGVYTKEKDKWTEVLPEVVNLKTGGVAKSIATVGIVKGDVNGHVNGGTSRNRLTMPIEFLIIAPEGEAITEYQLLRLHQHGSNREFRTVTGGVFHVSGGATRDLLPFDATKVSTRTYKVSLSVSAGEYGFLPPGAFTSASAASSGKIYSFRVIE